MKTALVTGITGQGGAYLSRRLIDNGYRVVGTSRSEPATRLDNLDYMDATRHIRLETLDLEDEARVRQLIRELAPDEIYHLAGPSSVARSFEQPGETINTMIRGITNILESIRLIDAGTRFFNASSIEIFGQHEGPIRENSPLNPRSPYGVGQASAFLQTRSYREVYGLFTCSGILSNFESPLRPPHFVTRKIVRSACAMASGARDKLRLGNTRVRRDWGWADDYMDAAWRMLQLDAPADLVIATGVSHSIEEFVRLAFQAAGLDHHDHVEIDAGLFRPLEIEESVGDPSRAKLTLGWTATYDLKRIVDAMVAAESAALADAAGETTALPDSQARPGRMPASIGRGGAKSTRR